MTDKELQRLKILEVYFKENNYIENNEVQKKFESLKIKKNFKINCF